MPHRQIIIFQVFIRCIYGFPGKNSLEEFQPHRQKFFINNRQTNRYPEYAFYIIIPKILFVFFYTVNSNIFKK